MTRKQMEREIAKKIFEAVKGDFSLDVRNDEHAICVAVPLLYKSDIERLFGAMKTKEYMYFRMSVNDKIPCFAEYRKKLSGTIIPCAQSGNFLYMFQVDRETMACRVSYLERVFTMDSSFSIVNNNPFFIKIDE